MAVLKLNREKEAEKDCTLAIMLDPNYAKAYIRQAYARLGLKRYSGAIKDYEKVLQIEPKNKMAENEIEKLICKKEEAKNNNSEKKKNTKSKSSFEEKKHEECIS
ncbi:RPAP3 [Lepeophtheirus salmonis]|uniref:RPAP3 n=1 Tax=Lepeophtheirus salmonis TaxID=72036 RepID=A0A7R8HBF0_LEPSM|nr:RPAP3 [Lepeophtheirus salmonis]CAF2993372.1 RPAP3 [Lepeophtheirus salmonis]